MLQPRIAPWHRRFRKRLARSLWAFVAEKRTVQAAAESLELKRSTLYTYLGRKRRPEATTDPQLAQLHRIANGTRVSLDSLFFARVDDEPIRYRDQSRDAAGLAADLSLELERRIVNGSALTSRFVKDYLQRHGMEDVLNEMAEALCRRALQEADRVRAGNAERSRDLAESYIVSRMEPLERMQRLVERFSALAPSVEDEAERAQLLNRPSPDAPTHSEIGEAVPVAPTPTRNRARAGREG